MLSLRKPSGDLIRQFLSQQTSLDFTYSAVGATLSMPPAGYVVDHTRILLGEGEKVFQLAVRALKRWDQFRLGWLEAAPVETPIHQGEVVAILARCVGLWWLNACRIISVIDETSPIHRFGFLYGTLPDHAATGEERFLIEWNHQDNSVWYDILAFSKPNHFLTRLGYPVVRWTQKMFGRESSAAMRRAVS